MPDRIEMAAGQLLQQKLESVPRYMLLKDVLHLDEHDPVLQSAYQDAMKSRIVERLCSRQLSDGSFGQFRIAAELDAPTGGVNESAMIRALSFGMPVMHPMLKGLASFLENMLEKASDQSINNRNKEYPIATQMVLTACLTQLKSSHPIVADLVSKWRLIFFNSLAGDGFDMSVFRDSCYDTFGSDYEYWPASWTENGVSRYSLLILQNQLPFAAEKKLVDYILSEARGIYPVSKRSLKYFPLRFASKESVRFIISMALLSRYPAASPYMSRMSDWLWEQIGADGRWDLGPAGRDNRHLPLSESWGLTVNRQIDCTVLILSLLSDVHQSCELYNTACHFL